MLAKQKHRNARHKKEPQGFSSLLLNAFLSAVISLGAFFFIAALLSALLMKSSDPLSLIFPASLLSIFLSSFLSGTLCMCKIRQPVIPCGLIAGGIFMTLYTLLALFVPNEFSKDNSLIISFLVRLAMVSFSILGSYITKKLLFEKRRHR